METPNTVYIKASDKQTSTRAPSTHPLLSWSIDGIAKHRPPATVVQANIMEHSNPCYHTPKPKYQKSGISDSKWNIKSQILNLNLIFQMSISKSKLKFPNSTRFNFNIDPVINSQPFRGGCSNGHQQTEIWPQQVLPSPNVIIRRVKYQKPKSKKSQTSTKCIS